jgi:hypothetical protein
MAPSLLGNQRVRKQRIGKSDHVPGRAYWRTGPDSSLSGGRQVGAQRRNGRFKNDVSATRQRHPVITNEEIAAGNEAEVVSRVQYIAEALRKGDPLLCKAIYCTCVESLMWNIED